MTTTFRIKTDTGEVETTPAALAAAAGARGAPVPSDASFVDGGEETDFQEAPDLEEVADDLIAREELHLSHLRDLRLAFLWKREGGKSKGAPTLGRCQKPSGLLKHFSGVDFVIWLAADHCRTYQFSRDQVAAALYHELCHAWVDEQGRPTVIGHDVEMFAAEVQQFGLWRFELQRAADAFQARMELGGGAS